MGTASRKNCKRRQQGKGSSLGKYFCIYSSEWRKLERQNAPGLATKTSQTGHDGDVECTI